MRNDGYISSYTPQALSAQTGDLEKKRRWETYNGRTTVALRLTLVFLAQVLIYFIKKNP